MTGRADTPLLWSAPANILCLRLDNIGDLLMTTPALRALKEQRPGRRLTLLTSSGAAPAASLIPLLDDVMVFDAPWVKAASPRARTEADLAMVELLRACLFDAAVIFTVYSQSPLPGAMLCYLAGIPLRLAHCRENPYRLLTHWVPDPEPGRVVRHEVRRQLDLVAMVGAATADERLCLRVPPEARASVPGLLTRSGIDPTAPWVLIHPGATAPSRRYPPGHLARAAAALARQGVQILFAGTGEESAEIEAMQHDMGAPSSSAAGRASFAELCALIEAAPVLVANNSAPAHIAAAVGTPVVDLYALTNPQHAPWRVRHRLLYADVPCRWCYKSVCPEHHHNCLRGVPPEEVAGAAVELLKGTPSNDHAGD